jgi:hypothetical protein
MRVIANGTGAEVIFMLLRMPSMTEELFATDAAAVESEDHTMSDDGNGGRPPARRGVFTADRPPA